MYDSVEYQKVILKEIIEENKIENPEIIITKPSRSGHLGESRKILIKGENESKIHVFVKLIPQGKFIREKIPLRDLFLNEIFMYEEVLPTFGNFQKEKGVKDPFKSFPKCYKTCSDENKELLIFEDLNELNYQLWDKRKPMPPQMIEYVFKDSAKLHAISYAFKDQKPEIYKRFSEKLSLYKTTIDLTDIIQAFKNNAEMVLKLLDKETTDAIIKKKFKNFVENDLKTIMRSNKSNSSEDIIIHGDSWCNNFMFKFEDNQKIDLILVDWQMSRSSSPVIDLSTFFYSHACPKTIENLDYFLKVYHETLSKNLKEMGSDVEKLFSYSTFTKHWKNYSKFGLACACNLLQHYCCSNSDDDDDESNEALNVDKLLENNGMNLIEIFTTSVNSFNNEYEDRMMMILNHFVRNHFI